MPTKATQDAANLLRDAVETLESPKGSVAAGVRMLRRAAMILSEREVRVWCEVQLGNAQYTASLENLIAKWDAAHDTQGDDKAQEALTAAYAAVKAAGVELGRDVTDEELQLKYRKSSGGFANIGFVEERYADLVKTKKGNDGTYYKNNLSTVLNYVRRVAHARAARLFNRVAYADTPQTSFDVLKVAVDDRLLDIAPTLAEQLMSAFRAISVGDPESRSQALTTCRRFIEGFADHVCPPSSEAVNGRVLGRAQYINRIWAFMDRAISSDSDKELAKRHVDYLGSYLEKIYKITNKGVHAEVTRVQAVKAVFHTYLIVADLLEYLDGSPPRLDGRLNIHTASLDELESILEISRSVAKSIVRLRAENGHITKEMLEALPGVGAKTLQRIAQKASF
jgi:hypothetical protein